MSKDRVELLLEELLERDPFPAVIREKDGALLIPGDKGDRGEKGLPGEKGDTGDPGPPGTDASLNAGSSDFALPADGHYVLGVVTTATVATSSHLHLSASLQMRNN